MQGAAPERRDYRPGFGPWADDGVPKTARDRAERIERNKQRDARSGGRPPGGADERKPAELRVTGRKPGAAAGGRAGGASGSQRGNGAKSRSRNPSAGPARGKGPTGKVAAGKPATANKQRGHSRRPPMREPRDELMRLGGRRGDRLYSELMAAAAAFDAGRERDARTMLEDLVRQVPDSPSVRELLGLTLYRLGRYQLAAKQLEAFVDLTGSVDQHPVLMDCYRALKRWRPLEELWDDLARVSPSAALVTEGRIVFAGALADRSRLPEAISLLRRKSSVAKQPRLDQVRLWYALADLEARAGNNAAARELFERVRRYDPGFAEVAERLAGL